MPRKWSSWQVTTEDYIRAERGKSMNTQHGLRFAMLSALVTVGLFTLARSHACLYPVIEHPQELLRLEELGHDASDKPWAMYSPYTPVAPYEPHPELCQVTQVNILQRHGSRYPTTGSVDNIVIALQKLQSAREFAEPSLAFLNKYQYSLGVEDLVPLGAKESNDAGRITYERYRQLIREDNIPFLRVSDSPRIIDTANHWIAGFKAASQHKYSPGISVFFSEKHGTNSTLDHLLCPAAGKSETQTKLWQNTFAPLIRTRLSSLPRLSASQILTIQQLTNDDIYALMVLCPFESVVYGHSSFCDLFGDEMMYSDYWGDLDKYYYTGYGQPLGPVQGVGYVNELIARLTSSAVRDHTQTNHTLDSNPLTFPLNRTIYADFSHDNQMIAIFSALGLFNISKPLDPTKIDLESGQGGLGWKASKMVPFAGRMVVEKMECEGEEKVRILVNDKVMPLDACGGVDGLCSLKAFVKSQAYARHDGQGDFEKCFELEDDHQ